MESAGVYIGVHTDIAGYVGPRIEHQMEKNTDHHMVALVVYGLFSPMGI